MTEKINIWGREFELKVIFDVYKGEEVTDIQKNAFDAFIKATDILLKNCEELKEYCLKQDQERIGGTIENIFKYVRPESLFIKRDNKDHIVVLLCNYRFDEEHGIAIFFKNEKLEYIGTQDDI